MTGNKKVLCKVCYKEMRSDVLTRHMKVHEPRGGSKRTHDEMEEEKAEALKKYLIKETKRKEKIALGKRVYRFLAQGVGSTMTGLEPAIPRSDPIRSYAKNAMSEPFDPRVDHSSKYLVLRSDSGVCYALESRSSVLK